MSERRIQRALIAVYDKTGLTEFARALVDEFGIEIISTGGTAKHLKDAGIPVTMVEEVTGFPEMLDGRVKTLHPKIHAAILADRDNPEHMRQLTEHGIEPIDMVVVNLYPFEKTVADPNCTIEQAIEMIDIGGPCLLRAAAKNHRHVAVVPSAQWYPRVIESLRATGGLSHLCSMLWAGRVFETTSRYDDVVSAYLDRDTSETDELPNSLLIRLTQEESMRYGENPHQQAGRYRVIGKFPPYDADPLRLIDATAVSMSYNNHVDADAALALCAELSRAHSNNEPRPSGRAAVPAMPSVDSNQVMTEYNPREPCWLLTWTTYGSWFPGDERGFVSRAPRLSGDHQVRNIPGTDYDTSQGDLRASAETRMEGSPVRLSQEHVKIVEEAFLETAARHGITLLAYSVMTDHVHLICQAVQDGSELLNLFKGVSARRLGQAFALQGSPRWWSKSGSKRYLPKGQSPETAIDYVISQPSPLIVRRHDELRNVHVHALRGAARPEGRGSLSEVNTFGSVAVFIKHTNACGVGIAPEPIEAYRRAYLGDPNAAMGGILAVNFTVTADFATTVMDTYDRMGKATGAGGFFIEVWVAPSFDDDAVDVIRRAKKWGEKVRLLPVGVMSATPCSEQVEYKSISGGMLVQTPDRVGLNEDQWKVVTRRAPTDSEISDLRLAWLIAKHTKSNAISICKDGMLIGNGAGQMSRVMSCRIATWLAKENGHAEKLTGAVAASDAFFPFRDGPDLLLDAGVRAIIQPGGSKRDEETIRACDERGATMIFTGTRHFRH